MQLNLNSFHVVIQNCRDVELDEKCHVDFSMCCANHFSSDRTVIVISIDRWLKNLQQYRKNVI